MSEPDAEQLRPDHAEPWALQMVIFRDRANPAGHTEVLRAAGAAVAALLDDERSRTGVWSSAVEHWRAGWVRKVARRADGKRWRDAIELPGVTRASGTARVRAYPPAPLRPLPRELSRLQVGGTEFPRTDESGDTDDSGDSAADAIVIVEVDPGLQMSTGKTAAQVGHAVQAVLDEAPDDVLAAWRAADYAIDVCVPTQAQWAVNERPVSIVDAGLTELSGPTETVRAYWRAADSRRPR